MAGTAVGAALLLGVMVAGALGADVTSATFSGGAGTASVNGTLYAKSGAALTLTVVTSSDTKCVELTRAGVSIATQTSSSPKSSWTFNLTAATGEGIQTVSASARPDFNQNDNCNGANSGAKLAASYIVDNTGPQVTGALSPAANAAGWNRSDVTIAWSATDTGSGVDGAPSPASETVTTNTSGATRTATAVDRVGNSGSGSVTVKLDKSAPTIDGARSPAPNAHGWNNGDVTVALTCADALSGIKTCTGGGTKVVSAEGADQSVSASATDNADNSASTTVGNINIDRTAPALSGAIASGTLGNDGWYTSDVVVDWTCSDALSGIEGACPDDSLISGEGQNLKATAAVSDKAGNERTADSPTVRIDKTAPNTDATAAGAWNNVDVTVQLTANDALSGVAATRYQVDGGAVETGTDVTIASEGVHTLEYWSVDNAGNVETHRTVDVKIDRTSPTITHAFTPQANANGWFNADVDVHFICSDEHSGIASCGPDRVVTSEGAGQDASGEAVDNAGNRATDPATVSVDKTAPTIAATKDRAPNANGWYDDDVTVSFACADALSGVDSCPAPKQIGEGAGGSASGTATDAAGNTASDGVSGVDVDKTAPSLVGTPTTAPNANGWYRGDVVVGWACEDALSGIDGTCPADDTVEGEGENLSASASVADKAGNTRTATVDGLKIDRTAPATAAEVAQPLESGWYAGAVEVKLAATDNLSGADTTYYRVDGGAAQVYGGPFSFDTKGIHEIAFWSVDRAGNAEDGSAPGNAIRLKIDGIAPRITGSRTPAANAFGWNNGPVLVTFDCADDESGIAGCSPATELANEGEGQSVSGAATDNAGNTSSTTVDGINIDLTAPDLAGAPTTDANAAGWYKGDVTVRWSATDGLSGVDPATVPADSVITGEGADLGAGPVNVADKAGNTGSASVGGIRIDRTPPVVSGAPTTEPNGAGWYQTDVIVAFGCTDALSGVASCPSDMVVAGNGADQSVTSVAATDNAGNSSEGRTVGGINVDGLPPQTTADNQCTKTNGWCTGSTATVVLTAADQAGLSGVKEIRYTVNGGAEQVAAGASTSVSVPLDGDGEATVRFHAVDEAGNREPDNGVALQYDNVAPMVTHTLTPLPNADEWHHSDVTVHFDARDNDGGSGVDPSRTTPDVVVSDETAGRRIDGEAYDVAGNRGSDSVTVKVDKTGPAISGAVVDGQRSASGWYTGPVTVRFTCADPLSDVAVCPADVTLTANGASQSVTREAVDFAGNRSSATVSGIDIDTEKPAVTLGGVADGAVYTLGAVPAAACSARDDVSGAGSCSVTTSGGSPNGVGTFTYAATATDRAGNTATTTGSYRVVYRFDGFMDPINNPGHAAGANTSIFKGNSTVPVKLQLKKADGTAVQANTLPVWLVPAKGGPTTAAVDESVYSDPADSTSTYRWEATGRHYQYNWQTAGAAKGYYHRIAVKLDDGQTYYVNIGLR